MEDLSDEVLEDLKAKAIERTGELEIEDNTIDEELLDEKAAADPLPSPPKQVKKSKKVRSEKQIAAFEKARIKRAENLKIKKEIEAEKKAQKKREKEEVKAEVKQRLEQKHEPPTQPALVRQNAVPDDRYLRVPTAAPGSFTPDAQPHYREQVVNNYYYYGTPPPAEEEEVEPTPRQRRKKQTKKKPKRPPTPSESEEEDSEDESGGANFVYDEPQSYKELQDYDEDNRYAEPEEQPEQPKLKFRFA